MGRLHVKFHEDRYKGEAFMRLKPFYLTARLQTDGQTDGRTDGHGDSSIPPPNFVAGGIINMYIYNMKYLQMNKTAQLTFSTIYFPTASIKSTKLSATREWYWSTCKRNIQNHKHYCHMGVHFSPVAPRHSKLQNICK